MRLVKLIVGSVVYPLGDRPFTERIARWAGFGWQAGTWEGPFS